MSLRENNRHMKQYKSHLIALQLDSRGTSSRVDREREKHQAIFHSHLRAVQACRKSLAKHSKMNPHHAVQHRSLEARAWTAYLQALEVLVVQALHKGNDVAPHLGVLARLGLLDAVLVALEVLVHHNPGVVRQQLQHLRQPTGPRSQRVRRQSQQVSAVRMQRLLAFW